MASHLRLASLWLPVAIATAAAGCSASLVSPTNDAGQDPAVADAGRPVLAIIYPSPTTTGDSVLALSNGPIDCTVRVAESKCSPTSTGVEFWVGVELPPQDVARGIYPLSSLINPYFSATGSNNGVSTDCWGGGGTFGEGSLEILSVSNTAVVFVLHGTQTATFDVNDTTFTAQVCPGA
jgi:hypothetical protein